nr:DUF3093 domain-containing protein [Rhodococcus sp. HNM0569]
MYSERLRVPVWWWVAALAVAALLAAEVHMGAPGLRAWLPYVILLPLAGGVMLWLGRLRVEVLGDAGNGGSSDGPLFRVGDARLPVSVIARVAEVPGTAKSAALGRQLDPAAFVQHRVWVKPMVLVVLDDPDDPTPYWLVSTRKPAEVVAALESARASR